MTKIEAIKWLSNLKIDIGKTQHQELWHYEQAIDEIIEILEQEPIIRCEECKHHGTSNCPMWGDDTTEDYMWCCDGERMESDEQ